MDFTNERLDHKGMMYKRGMHGHIFYESSSKWFKSEMKKSEFFKYLIIQKEELFKSENKYLNKLVVENERTFDSDIGKLIALQRGAKIEEDRKAAKKALENKRW